MRLAKRFTCVLLALVMILSLGVTAFADEGTTSTAGSGKITINNAVVGQTYTIYKILELESYNEDAGAYSYKTTTDWHSFITGSDIQDIYVSIENNYVSWKTDTSAEFAAKAKTFAEKLEENQGQMKAKSSTVEFTDLQLGYYLVVSDLGAICSLDTTNPNAVIEEKNGKPTVEKKVEEDSTKEYGKKNDADIGQTVNFKTTINVVDGNPKNYVLHDMMSAGLNFNGSVTVKVKNGTDDEVRLTAGTDYTLVKKTSESSDIKDDCKFEIRFIDKAEDNSSRGLKPNDVITVEYSATVNASAVIAGEGNLNETKLSYGNESTETSSTRTYVWQFDVFKYTNKDGKKIALKDAKFRLYKEVTGEDETKTKQYAMADEIKGADGKVTGYKLTDWTTSEDSATTFTSPENGKFSIIGLDADTYHLEETAAPAGYNKLKNPVTVTITGSYDEQNNTGTATGTYDTSSIGTVEVENKTGTELPSTGGVGTTIFYVLGSVLVIGAAVLLITKKRMNAEA